MHRQDWMAAIEMLVPNIHPPDAQLLALLGNCVREQGITLMEEAQALHSLWLKQHVCKRS